MILSKRASILLCHVWLWQQQHEPNEYFIARNTWIIWTVHAIGMCVRVIEREMHVFFRMSWSQWNKSWMHSDFSVFLHEIFVFIPFYVHYLWTLAWHVQIMTDAYYSFFLINYYCSFTSKQKELYANWNWYLIVWLIKRH